jgi:hypothetical protein
MSVIYQPSHRLKSIARLIGRLAKPNMSALIGAVADELQEVEDAFFDLLTKRILQATGVQLDVLGRIVDEARAGLDDASYLRIIFAKISANRSNGTRDAVYRVVRAALGIPEGTEQVSIQQTYIGPGTIDSGGNPILDTASFRVIIRNFFGTVALGAMIARLVGIAKLAGVRAVVEFPSFGYGDPFSCAWAWWLPSDVHTNDTVIPWSHAQQGITPSFLPSSGVLQIGETGVAQTEQVNYTYTGQFNVDPLVHDHPTGTMVSMPAFIGGAAYGAFADDAGGLTADPGFMSNALEAT